MEKGINTIQSKNTSRTLCSNYNQHLTHSDHLPIPPRETTTKSEFCNLTVLWNWSAGMKEEDTMVIYLRF